MKRGNTIFYIVGIIGILFIISPLLLHIPFIKQIYTIYLQSINTIDYKASYIETFGAMTGTFLAITGVFWTQRLIGKNEERKKIKENATIIYYDIDSDIKELHLFIKNISLKFLAQNTN